MCVCVCVCVGVSAGAGASAGGVCGCVCVCVCVCVYVCTCITLYCSTIFPSFSFLPSSHTLSTLLLTLTPLLPLSILFPTSPPLLPSPPPFSPLFPPLSFLPPPSLLPSLLPSSSSEYSTRGPHCAGVPRGEHGTITQFPAGCGSGVHSLLPHTCMRSKELRNQGIVLMSVCLSVCLSVHRQNIENTNNQLKYAVICSEKGTITTFELLFDGHSTDSSTYDLWELQIQSFLIFFYSLPAPPL